MTISQKEFKFIKLDGLGKDGTKVVCQQCNAHFSVSHGGRSDINQHLQSQKHQEAAKAMASTGNISSYFVTHSDDTESRKIAAIEAVIAYHGVRHGQSFRANDCLSKLIKTTVEPKFSSARTKSQAIICNVLAPHVMTEVIEELHEVKSVTLSLDASNKKDIKLFPIIVRYFLPNRETVNKIIDFVSLPGETSDLQCYMLKKVIQKFNLRNNIVALCADNTNTNFGGCRRLGKNNVWRKLEAELERKIIGIGCGAHIIHNCLQCAVDCLPIDIECFAVKVCKYFYIYSVRVEELKSFCEFAENNYNKVLQHGNTRFLSLGPSIERILSMFDGLRAYFLSQEKCPVMLRNIFQNSCLKLWLSFARDQVSTFQACIGQIKKGNILATEVAMTIENLLNNLKLKKQERFVTSDVKKQLEILVESGEIAEEKFFEVVESFYDTSLQYADKWICSLGNTDKFKWILLNKTPAWKEIGDSINHEILSCVQAEETRLFDQWVLIKLIAERHVDE